MTTSSELTTSIAIRTARDLHVPPLHVCAHCHHIGTTATGALWRVSPSPDCRDLYYLHSGCLAPYKAAHGLRSVEGRIPRGQPATVRLAARTPVAS